MNTVTVEAFLALEKRVRKLEEKLGQPLEIRPDDDRVITVQKVVSRNSHLSLQELLGDDRPTGVCKPRMIAMFLCRKMELGSSTHIGKKFKKDHGTVLNAEKRISKLSRRDPFFPLLVKCRTELREIFKNQ